MLKSRKFMASIFTSAVVAVGIAGPAAAQPVVTGGLVNVTIIDAIDVDRTTVQLPIAVAANVCGVDVDILAQAIRDTGTANCEARAGSRAGNRN
jgi:hypothetical protein